MVQVFGRTQNIYLLVCLHEPDMGEIIDNPRLREQKFVFSDRHDAGQQLGVFIKRLPATSNPLVLAIPAGGVPIGAEVAKALGAPFSVAIVRKIRIPGTTESGFGAVTWDGRVLINERLRAALGLSDRDVERAVAATMDNVAERVALFTKRTPVPEMTGKTVILTDDGLASGYTMLAAVESVKRRRAGEIIVAIPVASAVALAKVQQSAKVITLAESDASHFTVSDYYRHWHDVPDADVIKILDAER